MSQTLPAVSGAVKYVHTYMNMCALICCLLEKRCGVLTGVRVYRSFREFQLPNGTTVQTCPPAMGFSFAGGTT